MLSKCFKYEILIATSVRKFTRIYRMAENALSHFINTAAVKLAVLSISIQHGLPLVWASNGLIFFCGSTNDSMHDDTVAMVDAVCVHCMRATIICSILHFVEK